MGALVAVLDKKGNDATETALTMLSALALANTHASGIASPSNVKIERTIDALRKSNLNSPAIIGHRFSRILASDRPQPVLLEGAAMVFEGRTYPSERAACPEPTITELRPNSKKAVETFIRRSSADYAFVLAEPERLVAGRDPVGTRPLYYGENEEFAVLASERKALWKIGMNRSNSFPVGNLAIIDQGGFRFEPVRVFSYSEPKPTIMKDAARELATILKHSVAQRVSGLKEVAVAFSGGLDSSIIAKLAQRATDDVQLIHVSLQNQNETEHAKKAADALKLPIHIRLFREDDVENDLPKVLWLIEEPDPIQTSIGIPIYWAALEAARIGLKVMLAGQGADELFGGYKRYVDTYSLRGEEDVRRRIFRDIVELSENNLERDAKICSFHGVELRLPFATIEMARFALDLPVNLKVDPQKNGKRKLVLRRVARNIGLPELITEKPKKAVQYTTGADRTLKKLSKRQRVSVKDYLQKTFQTVLEKAI